MPTQSTPDIATSASGAFGGQISRESLSQQAYTAIRRSMMRSGLRPGQKLIARQVAEELGISVTPVRESLLRLVSEHALIIDERGTVMVPTLTLARCKEISDLRMLVEGEGAARAAIRRRTPRSTNWIATHERYMRTKQDKNFESALAENENFHFTLCRMARSPVLFRIVENLWMQFGPVLSHLYDDRDSPFHGETHGHIQVHQSLRKRDPEHVPAGDRARHPDRRQGDPRTHDEMKRTTRRRTGAQGEKRAENPGRVLVHRWARRAAADRRDHFDGRRMRCFSQRPATLNTCSRSRRGIPDRPAVVDGETISATAN